MHEARKQEARSKKQEARSKKARKQGSKKARKQESKEARKQGSKEARSKKQRANGQLTQRTHPAQALQQLHALVEAVGGGQGLQNAAGVVRTRGAQEVEQAAPRLPKLPSLLPHSHDARLRHVVGAVQRAGLRKGNTGLETQGDRGGRESERVNDRKRG